MNDLKPIDLELIQMPTGPQGHEADMAAQRTWQETGFVPMEYVQQQLRQGLSNGQTITDLVLSSIESQRQLDEAAPTSNRSK